MFTILREWSSYIDIRQKVYCLRSETQNMIVKLSQHVNNLVEIRFIPCDCIH